MIQNGRNTVIITITYTPEDQDSIPPYRITIFFSLNGITRFRSSSLDWGTVHQRL